ncbi:NAD-binding protein [Salinarchaeum sp. IM2453]|uniref:DHH family phosphoesterase n=1 Tax=Salinarchaeum sp. IM2453 TaxID=2862870 RepID=UPI001C8314AF|nr:DHH family phosphoesterase [Salinarchaeum sp. IM2453]QZA89194.1 NAD-binding protein [Salinarchaeum sp. IM2453]
MSSGVGVSAMSSYAILGCGSVGFAVAERLSEQGKDVLIIDRDEDRVEALRDQDLNAKTADMTEQSTAEAIANRDVVLMMAADAQTNQAALEQLREVSDDPYVVVRADDPISSNELEAAGADVVINPSDVIADYAVRSLETGELEHKVAQLVEVLGEADRKVGILTHDSPDPDSIASAAALQAIAEHVGVEADILYDGDLGHQENRAFVNLLDLGLQEWDEVEKSEYDLFAVVDLGEEEVDADYDILIDHHEPEEIPEIKFVDIRPNVSSTSTILTKYTQELDLNVSEAVATALLYGIRAETVDFKEETTPADLTAAAYLHPFADHDTLEQVESPSMSPETLDVLAEAIQNRDVRGSHLVSNAGYITERDALNQAAQHLLNLEGISTTAVFGIAEDTIYLAARSKDIRLDIGKVLQDAYEEIGETAGHSTQANVRVPMGIFTGVEVTEDNRDTLLELTEKAVKQRLFEAMGVDSGEGNGS